MYDLVVGNDSFAEKIAKGLGIRFRKFAEEYYPDGEACPRILAKYEELGGKKILLVSRMKDRPTKESIAVYLHNLCRLAVCLKDDSLYNASTVDVFLPYFIFGRQDHNPSKDPSKKIRERDAGKDIGYRSLAMMLGGCGVRNIYTFDPHFFRDVGTIGISGIKVHSLSAAGLIAKHLKNNIDSDSIILGPDMMSNSLVSKISPILRLKSRTIKKERTGADKVTSSETINAGNKSVVIVDDIISTASTVCKAIENIKNYKDVLVSCVHAVLPDVGYERIKGLLGNGKIKEFVSTDTIDSEFSRISVVPEIVSYLKGMKS